MKCRICNNENLKKFLSLGKTPLANSFLTKKDLDKKEMRFPLEVGFCDNCKLVQLMHVVPHDVMFKEYIYVSSTTNTFKVHFAKMAEEISKDFNLNNKSLAVDIGSNDGLLLKGFQKCGVNTIGVEPAKNIAEIAEQNGVETINDFFNENSVNEIIKKKGHADVITATNVFAHVDDIQGFVKNINALLNTNGIFVIEVPYLLKMLDMMTFDTIYHEHLSYFSVTPLIYFFDTYGLGVFKIKEVEAHGGSLRVFVKKKENTFKVDESVSRMLQHEKKIKIDNFEMYREFAEKVYNTREKLVNYIRGIKQKGFRIAAYGAPAKGNTLLNFCGIGANYIDYVIDDNPLKQNTFTPGTHIPVKSSQALDEQTPNYILILAWNFADEILSKTKKYSEKGVKFIIPLPEPRVV